MKEKFSRGLADLLNENQFEDDDNGENIINLPLELIMPNVFQPRKYFNDEKIKELAESIQEQGVFQPIIVKKVNDKYIIVSGERRYRASKLIGSKTIPAVIRQYEKSKVAEIALIENIQRENLSAVEEAEGYLRIIREAEITQEMLGKKIGKSRSHITNMLGILNLPENILALVGTNLLSAGHAKALSKLDNEKKINELTDLVIKKELSVRKLEKLIRENKTKALTENSDKTFIEPIIKAENNYRVKISETSDSLIIKGSKRDLEKIIKKLAG